MHPIARLPAAPVAASGRGQEFTFRVLASSGGNTGAAEVTVDTRPR